MGTQQPLSQTFVETVVSGCLLLSGDKYLIIFVYVVMQDITERNFIVILVSIFVGATFVSHVCIVTATIEEDMSLYDLMLDQVC